MKIIMLALSALGALALPSCQSTQTPSLRQAVLPAPKVETSNARYTGVVYRGQASWYSVACNGGTQTASGERLRDQAMTAAHKTLPMGTQVRVTNTRNGRSAIVRINDRGPYVRGRIIDVTKGVAQQLGMIGSGVAPVTVEVIRNA